MDKEQEELQFLGFFGIWRESFKIISKWIVIFLQLGLSLTLPLSFIYLTHIEISHLLLQNILLSISTLAITIIDDIAYKKALRFVSMELAMYALIQVAYIVFLLVFSLVSTSAIMYTVACIYSSKEATFKEVMHVVPKVWKRLMVTFLSVMAIVFVYNFVFGFIVMIMIMVLAYPMNFPSIEKYMLLGKVLMILYLAGVCYMGVIWQLANTISALEESYGYQALKKSKILMKGKMDISVAIFLVINLFIGGVLQLYSCFVMVDHSNVFRRVGLNIISLLILSIVIVLGIVVHTVFYFVCKSYHHEQIDKSVLVDHLKIYHGEGYVLLKPKDIQLMEQI